MNIKNWFGSKKNKLEYSFKVSNVISKLIRKLKLPLKLRIWISEKAMVMDYWFIYKINEGLFEPLPKIEIVKDESESFMD